jgi:hypothetical protein
VHLTLTMFSLNFLYFLIVLLIFNILRIVKSKRNTVNTSAAKEQLAKGAVSYKR